MTQKEFRDLRKKAGVCRDCGKEDAYTMAGRTYCAECAEKDRLRQARVNASFYKYGPARKNFGEGRVDALATAPSHHCGKRQRQRAIELEKVKIEALRPITREQVEKVWKGEWIIQQDEHREFTKKCPKCGFPISGWWGADKFCANCGAPMTDEAVDMVMERLEELKNEIG